MREIKRVDYPLQELPSGDHLNLSSFTLKGDEKGPHVYIQANVHGAEIQGNAVIHHLLEHFLNNPFRGTITFVPNANPMGQSHKSGTFTQGRFNPKTGDNWNRLYTDLFSKNGEVLSDFVNSHLDSSWEEIKTSFKNLILKTLQNVEKNELSYGPNENKKLFLLLQKLSATADIVLDLHTGPIATEYIYSAKYQEKEVFHFNFPFVLHIPNNFAGAKDEATFINWYRLYEEFKNKGKSIPLEFNSFTVELGSEEIIDLDNAQTQGNNILNYLNHKKVLDKSPEITLIDQYHTSLENFKTYYSPHGGVTSYHKSPGDHVQAGEILATTLSFDGLKCADDFSGTLKEFKALNDCIIINHCPSGNLHQGMELYQVIENYKRIKKLDSNS